MKHGWFSPSQYQFGSAFWLSVHGHEVEVTHVSEGSSHDCLWSDMVYLGVVEKFLRDGYRPPEYNGDFAPDWEEKAPEVIFSGKLRFVNRIAKYI